MGLFDPMFLTRMQCTASTNRRLNSDMIIAQVGQKICEKSQTLPFVDVLKMCRIIHSLVCSELAKTNCKNGAFLSNVPEDEKYGKKSNFTICGCS